MCLSLQLFCHWANVEAIGFLSVLSRKVGGPLDTGLCSCPFLYISQPQVLGQGYGRGGREWQMPKFCIQSLPHITKEINLEIIESKFFPFFKSMIIASVPFILGDRVCSHMYVHTYTHVHGTQYL